MWKLVRLLREKMVKLTEYLTATPFNGGSPGLMHKIAEPSPKPDEHRNFDYTVDLQLIQRFSHDWSAHSHAYRATIGELRSAARRLLPLCAEVEQVKNLEDEITCLARQPLYFPEIFHGMRLLHDGSFTPLDFEDRILLRASGLISPGDRTAIREIYRRISQAASTPLRVAEIGSAGGRGSTRIAGEWVKRSGGTLYCIDPWEGVQYFAFLANLQVLDLEKTIVPIRGLSWEAAALFDDGSLDAAFIDGGHFHPDVLADIDAYLPKIRKGGYLFGHDLNDLPSRFDRRELLSKSRRGVNEIEVSHITPSGETERINAHPGVILAVQDRFGDQIELWPNSVVWAKHIS